MGVFYKQAHLETMCRALKEYIIDKNNEILQKELISLKANQNSDATAIDHLLLALYSFQVSFYFIFKKNNLKCLIKYKIII